MKVLHSRQGSEIRFDDRRECLLSDLGCMVFVWHPSFLATSFPCDDISAPSVIHSCAPSSNDEFDAPTNMLLF